MTGGHAPGVRVYLGSGVLQSAVADFFAQKKPVGDFGTDPTGTPISVGSKSLSGSGMVTGERGWVSLSPLLEADANGRSAYLEMEQSDAGFRRPISYGKIRAAYFLPAAVYRNSGCFRRRKKIEVGQRVHELSAGALHGLRINSIS